MKRILLIEDDMDLNKGLAYDLELSGFRVYPAFTLSEGRALLQDKGADLILLDGSLPDGDGFAFCRELKQSCSVPVIFLTARDMEQDEMQGFDCGADDYITKPFRMPILHRRIEAVLRRQADGKGTADDSIYTDGMLQINFSELTASIQGAPLPLTPTEFKIIRLLTANKTVTKQLLLEKIWDSSGNYVDEHAVAVNIGRLRKKLNISGHDFIKTMYGMGYQWQKAEGAAL